MLSTKTFKSGALRLVGLALLAVIAAPGSLAAQADFQLPPPPDDLPPYRAGEFYGGFVFPVSREPLCPDGAACLFGGGGAIGAAVEWRWPRGAAFGFGYDVWLLDGNGVYEITTVQYFKGQFRYYGLRSSMIHPFVGADIGFVLLGDSFRRNVAGAGVGGSIGFELEITSTLAFTSHLDVRAFATGAFVSATDRVSRAGSFGVDVAASLIFGLVLAQGP